MNRNRDKIRSLFEGTNFIVGYSPCKQIPCENGGSCSDKLVIYDDARITDSQALILTSPRMIHEMTCKCRDGFTGDKCERRQDLCSPNPCLLVNVYLFLFLLFYVPFSSSKTLLIEMNHFQGGQCRRLGYDFQCTCPIDREGKLCELERGDACASNPCRNGGSCRKSPDSFSFFCLCRAGYRGNHCEAVTDSCRPNPCLYGGLCVGEKPG